MRLLAYRRCSIHAQLESSGKGHGPGPSKAPGSFTALAWGLFYGPGEEEGTESRETETDRHLPREARGFGAVVLR